MQYRPVLCSALLAMMGVAAPGHAETVEGAIKKLVEAHTRLSSYSASVRSTENLDFGNENTMKSTITGTVEWMRKSNELLFRSDATNDSVQKFNGLETPTHATVTMISDGEFFYKIENVMGEVHVGKDKPSPMLSANAEVVLNGLKGDHELKLLREERWGDAPCYVIEATPKETGKSELMARALYYFRQDTGMAVRTMGFDAKGKVVYTIEHSDVKANPKINPDRFVFTMPEGAKFTDYLNP